MKTLIRTALCLSALIVLTAVSAAAAQGTNRWERRGLRADRHEIRADTREIAGTGVSFARRRRTARRFARVSPGSAEGASQAGYAPTAGSFAPTRSRSGMIGATFAGTCVTGVVTCATFASGSTARSP